MKSVFLVWLFWVLYSSAAVAGSLPEFDFAQPAVASQWQAVRHVGSIRQTPEGLEIAIVGPDPALLGPLRDYPADSPLWLRIRMWSEQGGRAEVFYFRGQPRQQDSVRFSVPAGQWTDARIRLPPLGLGYRLRIDPPGDRGRAVIAAVHVEPAMPISPPRWPKPGLLSLAGSVHLENGAAQLQVSESGFGVAVAGHRVAVSHARPLLGFMAGDGVRWLELGSVEGARTSVEQTAGGVERSIALRDPEGATWRLTQRFKAGAAPGVIDVEVAVQVDRDREVVFLPLLLLVAHEGARYVGQGLFAGLEYLDNEPSSSEADLVGHESRRQVPASHKITFPLMALQRDGRYVGLIWEPAAEVAALFDTPDRALGTGGHVMGMLFPGSGGSGRRDGALLPEWPQLLPAGQELRLRASIVAGTGASVVPAIQQYVRLRGLPPVPQTGYSFSEYVRLAAHGWLDSRIRDGNLYRHAFGQGFSPKPAADAATFMQWLAANGAASSLGRRLEEAAQAAVAAVPPTELNESAVGHVRFPLPALAFGHVAANAERARLRAQALLKRFSPNDTVPYARRPNGPDYGRTHFAPDANGLTASVVAPLLEAAVFSGDPALIGEALTRLRALNRFRNTVPRGAQSWEIPLHAPDILAAANLVRAFTLGYELTGEHAFLEQAAYWAWTGVPFAYLAAPVGASVPNYATIAVLSATNWSGRVWIGRPVQWCGLVYADAIYRLARHDHAGPWKPLADGITATGILHTWPTSDRARGGLLADYWEMPDGVRAGPAINPGTVQANAARLYGGPLLFDFAVLRRIGEAAPLAESVTVHAPGEIAVRRTEPGRLVFTVDGWLRAPYFVLINGVRKMPRLRINGEAAPLDSPNLFQPTEGRLILQLSGRAEIELVLAD